MGKILKKGKVVIMLAGRYAGKKAVVVKTFDQGTTDKSFAYALVAGVARNPRKVTKSMSKKKMSKKLKIKPFIKAVNFTHLMHTMSIWYNPAKISAMVSKIFGVAGTRWCWRCGG